MKVVLSTVVTPHFHSFWRASNSGKYLRHVLKGGRGSAKSTHIALKVIKDMMKHKVSALVIRKVGATLDESVFEQLKEAIDMLGVSDKWKITQKPLRMIYKPWGNRIIFRGADDPAKIKSIKVSKYPIAILWLEEPTEFKVEEEVTTIENSVIRAELPDGLHYSIYYSYNPPKRKQSWLNKKYESHDIPANTYVHHSTYKDNPHISKAFIEEAEEVKRKNLKKYEWEYEGKPIGSGVVPFENLTFRRIYGPEDEDVKRGLVQDEISTFDNIRQGVDWGYGVDPFAFVRWHYDKTRRRIYALDEIYGVKLSNRAAAEQIKSKGYETITTTADSAEPKSIDEMHLQLGVRMRGAKKGPGSVEYGEKWLDDLDEIIIDPRRTPNLAREFESIDYKTDADGNIRAELEDKDNHTIDATRYAFEDDMRQSGLRILR